VYRPIVSSLLPDQTVVAVASITSARSAAETSLDTDGSNVRRWRHQANVTDYVYTRIGKCAWPLVSTVVSKNEGLPKVTGSHPRCANNNTLWFIKNTAVHFVIITLEKLVRLSVVCMSVCRSVCLSSVVCNARAPYSGGCNFLQSVYGIWYLGHPLTSTEYFMEIVPGEPVCRGELNTTGVVKYSEFGPIEGYISETVQDRRWVSINN